MLSKVAKSLASLYTFQNLNLRLDVIDKNDRSENTLLGWFPHKICSRIGPELDIRVNAIRWTKIDIFVWRILSIVISFEQNKDDWFGESNLAGLQNIPFV